MFEQQCSKFIFLSCLAIVTISFVSLIFPALFIEITNDIVKRDVNLLQFGAWAIPIIASNLIFIICFILFKKNKLPIIVTKRLDFILENDLSKRITFIILLILFFIYIVFTIDEFGREEFELDDYIGVIEGAKNFEFTEIFSITPQLRYFILHISYLVFENVRILPYVASIFLLIITFFITLQITKKRISAIIALSVLLQSNLFLIFDTTATYENFWTAFYFLSLYLILRKPSLSAAAFVLSMMTKPLTIVYMPINIFAILFQKITKRKKIIYLASYGFIILIILIAFTTNNLSHVSIINFDLNRLISAINEMGNSLRFDSLILILMIPMVILLSTKTGELRNRVNIIFIGISIAILSQPIMFSLISMTAQPYRFIPLIVFSAIGIGIIFSKSSKEDLK